jgi:hypothetical protein
MTALNKGINYKRDLIDPDLQFQRQTNSLSQNQLKSSRKYPRPENSSNYPQKLGGIKTNQNIGNNTSGTLHKQKVAKKSFNKFGFSGSVDRSDSQDNSANSSFNSKSNHPRYSISMIFDPLGPQLDY